MDVCVRCGIQTLWSLKRFVDQGALCIEFVLWLLNSYFAVIVIDLPTQCDR